MELKGSEVTKYGGDGRHVKSVVNGETIPFAGGHYEQKGNKITKYHFAGASRIAVRTSVAPSKTNIVDDYLEAYGIDVGEGVPYNQKLSAAKAAAATGDFFYKYYGAQYGFTSSADAFKKNTWEYKYRGGSKCVRL